MKFVLQFKIALSFTVLSLSVLQSSLPVI